MIGDIFASSLIMIQYCMKKFHVNHQNCINFFHRDSLSIEGRVADFGSDGAGDGVVAKSPKLDGNYYVVVVFRSAQQLDNKSNSVRECHCRRVAKPMRAHKSEREFSISWKN